MACLSLKAFWEWIAIFSVIQPGLVLKLMNADDAWPYNT